MDAIKTIKALGLVSGSALEGVNIALITTDGVDVYDVSCVETIPFDDDLRERIRDSINSDNDNGEVEAELANFQLQVVKDFLKYYDEPVDVIGFNNALPIGDGQLLADITKIKVVDNFGYADKLAGGNGSPMFPTYHAALTAKLPKPLAVLNIGGVSSLTWLGENGELIAFDTGPGNSIINNWCFKKAGQHMDYNGKFAITGRVEERIVAHLMRNKFFAQYPPKAVDKDVFKGKMEHLEGLSLEDGAATATAFVAESIAYAINFYLPIQPQTLIVCGGGAKNPTLVRFIRQRLLNIDVKTGRDLSWDVDTIEAQAYAYLAVRRLFGLPASFPTTTGAAAPIICGQLHIPK